MRIWVGALLAVVSMSAVAAARPLPKGMKITVKKERLYVELRGITVPMHDAEAAARDPFGSVESAELSDDGEQIIVKGEHCDLGATGEGVEVALASIEARVENTLGMQLHSKKKYADAIPHFAAAAKRDPETPLYATNLLSAQTLARQLDDADQTLAQLGPGNVAWFAWRLAVDPELAALRGRPSTRAVTSARPPALTWARLGGDIATSPFGLAAVSEWTVFGGPGALQGDDLVIYDIKLNRIVLRLPVVAQDDACGGPPEIGVPCTRAAKARTAEHTRVANLVLAALGFAAVPTIKLEQVDTGFASSDHQITLEPTADPLKMMFKRGKISTVLDDAYSARWVSVAGNLVVLRDRENGFMGCSGDAQRTRSTFYPVK